MADTIEKIYCTDGRDNDLAAILAATKNNDPTAMLAAMGGGMNNWMNNPFVYLVWMMFANRMWGGEQNGNPAIQALKDCCCQTQQNIIKMGYENQLGQKDIVNALQQGFAYTNTGIERAASNLGFQMSQMACDLKNNDNMGIQRIIDTMNGHWNQELQLKYNDSRRELSQRDQTQAIVAGITAAVSQIIAANKTTTTTP